MEMEIEVMDAMDNLEAIPSRRTVFRNKGMMYLRMNLLTIATMIGLLCGIIVGMILKYFKEDWTPRQVMYLGFVGHIFLRMLKGIIIPLMFSCIVTAISSVNIILTRKIATRGIVYYFSSTVLAVITGITLALIFRPGLMHGGDKVVKKEKVRQTTAVDSVLDLIRNMFPSNIIEACIRQTKTELIPPENKSHIIPKSDWEITLVTSEHSNIIGVICFACAFGASLSILRAHEAHHADIVTDFFRGTTAVMLLIVHWIVFFSPVGILFLVAAKIIAKKNILAALIKVAFYFLTVIIGLFMHTMGTLPGMYYIMTKRNPYRYLMNMSEAAITAFGTGSSAATLPYTLKCSEEKNNIDRRISRFILPIGATINMDGTALYEAVAVIFIAQARNVILRFDMVIAIGLTAVAASVGAAAIPESGLVTMVMVLHSVGLNADDIAYVLAIDWLLDRFRTAVNVLSDAVGAGIVQELSKKELETMPPMEDDY